MVINRIITRDYISKSIVQCIGFNGITHNGFVQWKTENVEEVMTLGLHEKRKFQICVRINPTPCYSLS